MKYILFVLATAIMIFLVYLMRASSDNNIQQENKVIQERLFPWVKTITESDWLRELDDDLIVDQNGRGGSDVATDENMIWNEKTEQFESFRKTDWNPDTVILKDGKKIAEYSDEEIQDAIKLFEDVLNK